MDSSHFKTKLWNECRRSRGQEQRHSKSWLSHEVRDHATLVKACSDTKGNGIQSINNPLHIIWKFLWGPVGWAADYSRAYRSVITGDISNAVRRFFWYKNPADETTLTEYCLVRLNYGDSVSSAALEESIRSYIAPECRHQLASSMPSSISTLCLPVRGF